MKNSEVLIKWGVAKPCIVHNDCDEGPVSMITRYGQWRMRGIIWRTLQRNQWLVNDVINKSSNTSRSQVIII